VDTFDFLLNPLFFGYSAEKSKTGFLKLRVLPELATFEWWISGLRLDPLFFLISRLT